MTQLHIEGKCDFDFLNDDEIVSAGADFMLYIYKILSDERTEMKQEIDFDNPSIACNQFGTFAIGGSNDKVETFQDYTMVNPYLINTFEGSINSIIYSQDSKYLAIASESNVLNLFNYDTKLNVKCRPSHESMAISAAFDPLNRMVASIGLDGQLLMFQLTQTPELIRKFQVAKDNTQKIIAEWHPSGNFLMIPGKEFAQIIQTDEQLGDVEEIYQIKHEKNIEFIRWVNQQTVISATSQEIKIWHFKSKTDAVLLWQTSIDSPIQQMRYKNNTLFVLELAGIIHKLDISEYIKTQEVVKEKMDVEYEQVYSSKENALSDLLQKKVKKSIEKEQLEQIEDELEEKEEQKEEAEVEVSLMDKRKKVQSRLEKIIDVAPQGFVYSSQTSEFRGRSILLWNHVGKVVLSNLIEVEFSDRHFHKQFKIENTYHFSIAAMNYRGIVLASQIDEDQYDENEGSYKVYFQQFGGEEVLIDSTADGIAIGNDWFSFISNNTVQVYSFSGHQITTFDISRPFVSMCAYENLLIVIYLDSVPMFGCQAIKAKVWDIENCEQIYEIDVPISIESKLKWIGFSEDGLLISQDSKGIVRGYQFQKYKWVQLFNDKKFWLISICEYQIMGIRLDEDENEPNSLKKYVPDFADFDFQCPEVQKEICLMEFKLQHETERVTFFSHLNMARKSDVLTKYSGTIWNDDDFNQIKKKINKAKLDLFLGILEGSIEKAVEYFKVFMDSEQLMNGALIVLEKNMGQSNEIRKLYDKLRQLQHERLIRLANKLKYQPTEIQVVEIQKPQQLQQQQQMGQSYGLGFKGGQQAQKHYTQKEMKKDQNLLESIENRLENMQIPSSGDNLVQNPFEAQNSNNGQTNNIFQEISKKRMVTFGSSTLGKKK